MNRIVLLCCLVIFSFQACKTPTGYTENGKTVAFLSSSSRVAFYNVENLFDTIDDPNKPDEEFTPNGKKKWTPERYQKKLAKLSQVIETMDYPAFVGVCEVENEQVLRDLISTEDLKKYNYNIAHRESPDYRGIDVALIYNQDNFKVDKTDVIRINFPKEIVEDYTTRDILYVKGVYNKKETLHIFVNHWPSRRGGLKESEPKRMYVAEQLRQRIDDIFEKEEAANMIIMGDFNDETTNNSLSKGLKAQAISDNLEKGNLYNLFSKMDEEELGTYNYRGNWNMLDQIIVSTSLANPSHSLHVQNPEIVKRDWMIYKHDKYGETPNRTYGGPNYYGGISDHFPVFIELKQ